MSTWRERKQPASWRGVPFYVDGDELTAGRRGQVHEYPQRDKPYVEDLGRKARKITFTAFVIGSDYMDRRDALLKAVEEAGSGTLVHPDFGSLTVSLDPEADCRFSHSRDHGGYCAVQLAFVESGELAFPASRIDTRSIAWNKADDLDDEAAADFEDKFKLDGLPDFIKEGALSDIGDGLDLVEKVMSLRGTDVLSLLRGELTDLIEEPLSLADRIQGLFQSFGSGDEGSAMSLAEAASFEPSRQVEASTPSRVQEADNQSAVASLFRRAALAQASRVATNTTWTVRDDALSVRDALASRYRAEEDVTTSNAVFPALTASRLATVQDIGQRAKPLPQLRRITPPGPVPALVLSYDLYETTGREADIVARNRIPHPGFIPRRELLVTSK